MQTKIKKQRVRGRIRSRDRYLNLKNVKPKYSALDHSAIVVDENWYPNGLYILLGVEY